ncbi:MAG: winged helix-turn-helix transcriptional regulator, partial [Erysipelothrix sp.]|nr:winged helix-turn-helix transcriptional regulator [Erysipelothrix sp.]
LKIDRDRYQVTIDNELVHLTKKEYDLLLYLVENIDHVVSREQILNVIWNFDYDGDTRIVDVHIFKLRSKLAKSESEIKSIRGVGYVFKAK